MLVIVGLVAVVGLLDREIYILFIYARGINDTYPIHFACELHYSTHFHYQFIIKLVRLHNSASPRYANSHAFVNNALIPLVS
jgi:hypothetical protein